MRLWQWGSWNLTEPLPGTRYARDRRTNKLYMPHNAEEKDLAPTVTKWLVEGRLPPDAIELNTGPGI